MDLTALLPFSSVIPVVYYQAVRIVQQKWHSKHWPCADGCRYRSSSGTCARGRLALSVQLPTVHHSSAVVPVEPLESSDTFEPGLWASMAVPPALTGCEDIVNNTQLPDRSTEPAQALWTTLHYQCFPSICVRRVSKRRAWGAAQAMQTFRIYRSAVKTGWVSKGLPGCVSPAVWQEARYACMRVCFVTGRLALQRGSALLVVVVYESHYRRVNSH